MTDLLHSDVETFLWALVYVLLAVCRFATSLKDMENRKSYIGESGRALGTRSKEHQKVAEKIGNRKYTIAQRKKVNVIT